MKKDITKLEARLNTDSTNSGIPTSKNRIDAKIPNTREKTNGKIGGQLNHPINKLKELSEEEITYSEEKTLDVCPKCGGELKEINIVKSDIIDFKITVEKVRYNIHNYKCTKCGKKISADSTLPRGVSYGNNVKATILSMLNESNTAINKIKKHIYGITNGEINVSEGYICKLQAKYSQNLNEFIKDLKQQILSLKILHWDDGSVTVQANNEDNNEQTEDIIIEEDNAVETSKTKDNEDTKKIRKATIRFYGNDQFSLLIGHSKKNKDGIDKDGILSNLRSDCVCVHDHVLLNYNDEYDFQNAECNQHVLRALKGIKDNLKDHTWQDEMKNLLNNTNIEKGALLSKKTSSFSKEKIRQINDRYDEIIKLAYNENDNTEDYHFYKDKEKVLIKRLEKFKENHLMFATNFSVPFTNNTSELGIRQCKRKIAVSFLFKNVSRLKDYATMISYLETCHRNGVNRYNACKRLVSGNPYTIEELKEIKSSSYEE